MAGDISKNEHPIDLFILSESGKPIYCYSRRDDVITLVPLCQAIISCFADTQQDTIKYIYSKSGLKITFSVHSPLIIVVVVRSYCGIDPLLLINQVNAQVVSVLTERNLKYIFEQTPTFDFGRLLGGSEKLFDVIIEEGFIQKPTVSQRSKDPFTQSYIASFPVGFSTDKCSITINTSYYQNFNQCLVNRIMVPLFHMNSSSRDAIINEMNNSISQISSQIAIALLLNVYDKPNPVTKLIAVSNISSKTIKLNPLDIQLIQCLVIASENQLQFVECLYLPLCLPRANSSIFMYAHLSYLFKNKDEELSTTRFCLVLLTYNREDITNCRSVKDLINERLKQIKLVECPLTQLKIPCLQFFWYNSVKPFSIFHQSSKFDLIKLSHLMHYIAKRMYSSRLKTFWLRSDQHKIVLLGWHSSVFQLYSQFHSTATKSTVLNAAQSIIKWIKKEEDKLILKEYQ